jgi:hypothetical protein
MPSRRLLVAPLLALCALAACGGGGSTDVEELPAAYAQALCARAVRCGEAPEQGSCEKELRTGELERLFQQVVVDVKAGKIKYDGSIARRCLDLVAGVSCTRDGLFELGRHEGCQMLVQGTVARGGACTNSNQCADRGICTKKDCQPGDACCQGTCAPRPKAVGDACTGSSDCPADAYCAFGSTLAGVCKPRAAVGQPCDGFSTCVVGAFCASAGDRRCVAYLKDGEACTASSECASTTSTCESTTKTCRPRAKPGAACAEATDCVSYATCTNGACVVRPTIGESCSVPDAGALAQLTVCRTGQCQGGTCVAMPVRLPCK